MLSPARVVLAVALLSSCTSGGSSVPDACGPNQLCPDGFTCDLTSSPTRCVVSGSVRTDELTVVIAGMGSVAVAGQATCAEASCVYTVGAGSVQSLAAQAAAGWRFTGWGGDCAGAAPEVTVAMDAARGCTATFAPADDKRHLVTVAADSGGTVASTPALACSAGTCTGQLGTGDVIVLTAMAAPGYRFGGWLGTAGCDGRTERELSVSVTGEIMCRATFVQVFTVTASGGATVQAGACGGTSCTVDKGSTASLVAPDRPGQRFTGWSGDAPCTGGQPTLTVTVTAPTTCSAGYVDRFVVAGEIDGHGGAITATSSDATSVCAGSACTADAGALVTLVAPTVAGYRLAGWRGCEDGAASGSGLTIAARAPLTCTAIYVAGVSVSGTIVGATGQIVASSASAGSGCTAGQCVLDAGGDVALAAPDLAPAYRFVGWSGDAGCAGAGLSIALRDVQSSTGCTATYVRRLRVRGAVPVGLAGAVIATAAAGSSCAGDACTVDAGQAVTLTAPAIAGHSFLGWSGCSGSTPTIAVTPTTADLTCIARYALGVSVAGAPADVTASSTSPGADCRAGSACTIDQGGDVVLAAADRAPGERFLGWSGDPGCSGLTRAITVKDVQADTACVAGYVPRVTIGVAVEAGIAGAATVTTPDPTATTATGSVTVDAGQSVTLTAPVLDGIRFLGWTGTGPCQGATDNPLTFAAEASVTCTASYVQQVTVSATASGGAAAVTVTAGGCTSASCLVDTGGSVTLTAAPLAGYRFTGWSGDPPCVGSNPSLTFVVAAATRCTAGYIQRVTVGGQLQDGLAGAVAATAAAPAICSGASCVADLGQAVTLVAPTVGGHRLTGWSGSGCSGTTSGSGLTVVAAADVTCIAEYALGVSVTGTLVGAAGAVTATSTSPGASCGNGSCALDAGGSVTLTSPDLAPGDRFAGWSGDAGCTGTALSLVIPSVQSSVSCTATWVPRFTVTGAPAGVTGDCGAAACTVDAGQSVTLTAPLLDHHRFTGWNGAGCGSGNPLVVTPTANLTCTAQYAPTVTVTARAAGAAPTLTASSTSPGNDCRAGNACALDAGGAVKLSTTDVIDFRFLGWSGDPGCAASTLSLQIPNVQADTTCTAGYVPRERVTGVPSTVSVASSDPNVACSAPSSCTVDKDQPATLTAPARTDFRFTGWSGDAGCTGTSPTLSLPAVEANVTCTANYVPQYTISAMAADAHGMVTAKVGVQRCPGDSCVVDAGTIVTLQATASQGYHFSAWSGDAPCTGGATLPLSNVKAACFASFAPDPTYTATGQATPPGTGTVTVTAGACQSTSCSGLPNGTQVTFMPMPSANYHISSWSASCPGGAATINGADVTCTATFAPDPTYTATGQATTPGTGTVKVTAGACQSTSCSGLPNGTQVTFMPTPSANYHFGSWSASCPGGSATINGADVTCTATFAPDPTYTATGQATTPGTGTVKVTAGACQSTSCSGLPNGTQVTFMPTPSANYHFGSWSASCPGGSATINGADVTCTATFAPDPTYTATGQPTTPGTGTVKVTAGACQGSTSCSGLPNGTQVTFMPTPSTNYHFGSWSASCPGGVATIAAADVTCTVTFAPDPTYTATGQATTPGTGTVKVTAGACQSTSCSGLPTGTQVTFMPTPSANYHFGSWSASCPGGSATIAAADITCTVTFAPDPTYTATGQTSPSGAGTVTVTAGACQAPSCSGLLTGTTVTFAVTPAPGYGLKSWSPSCAGGSAVIGSADLTCTALLVNEWAISIGSDQGNDDVSAALTMPDSATVNVLGNSAANLMVMAVDAVPGTVRTPTLVTGPFASNGGRGMAQVGSDAVFLTTASGATALPVVGRLTGGTDLAWAVTLPFAIPGFTLGSDAPIALAASGDGYLRVASKLVGITTRASLQEARLSAVKTTGDAAVDVLVCDLGGSAGACGTSCLATTPGPIADATGQGGTVMTLTSSGGFFVVFVNYDGSLRWQRSVVVAEGASAVPIGAGALPDGRVVVTGVVNEPGSSALDGFYLSFRPDGGGGFTGGATGYTVGRAGTSEYLAGAAAGQGGQLALTGMVPDQKGSFDAWMVLVGPDGSVGAQLAYGVDGSSDRAIGAVAAPGGGYVLAGATTSFGGSGSDLWLLRTDDGGDLSFNAASGAQTRATIALRGGAASATSYGCLLASTTAQSNASLGGVAATTTDIGVGYQAP